MSHAIRLILKNAVQGVVGVGPKDFTAEVHKFQNQNKNSSLSGETERVNENFTNSSKNSQRELSESQIRKLESC